MNLHHYDAFKKSAIPKSLDCNQDQSAKSNRKGPEGLSSTSADCKETLQKGFPDDSKVINALCDCLLRIYGTLEIQNPEAPPSDLFSRYDQDLILLYV